MPSPVPISCSAKSLNGWMTLLPSAAGTMNAPPLIAVPAGEVVIERVWQTLQPIASNSCDPAIASEVPARAVSRGGTFDARMNAANSSMSLSGSSLPGTWSNGSLATFTPIDVFSVSSRRLVIPISFR